MKVIGWKYEALATKDLFELLNPPGAACLLVFLFKSLWVFCYLQLSSGSVQAHSRVRLFETPWTAACQASLSITNSWSLLKLHWVGDAIQPSHPLLSPFPPVFSLSQHQSLFKWITFTFASGGQSIGASASAPILPMNIQDWFPLGLTGLIWDSQESSSTPQFKSINSLVLSFLYGPTLTSIHNYWKICSSRHPKLRELSWINSFFLCIISFINVNGE